MVCRKVLHSINLKCYRNISEIVVFGQRHIRTYLVWSRFIPGDDKAVMATRVAIREVGVKKREDDVSPVRSLHGQSAGGATVVLSGITRTVDEASITRLEVKMIVVTYRHQRVTCDREYPEYR